MATTQEPLEDTRKQIWKESLPLVAAYPITGCGLGAYESCFLAYKKVAPGYTVDFAHNDYLQVMAEFGLPAFALLLTLTALARDLQCACTLTDEKRPPRTGERSRPRNVSWPIRKLMIDAMPSIAPAAADGPRSLPPQQARSSSQKGLKGALLICHGMVDTNVEFQDTVRLMQRLIELRKENWSVAPYPVEDHTFVQASSWADEYKRILKLFETNLK
jgi:hypothetical protein